MLLLLAAFLPGFLLAQSESVQVPTKVASAFADHHHSSDVAWQAGPQNTYEAAFHKSGKNLVYVYDRGGRLVRKKQETEAILLPTSIGNTLAYDYPAGNIEKAYRVFTKNKNKYYEVHLAGTEKAERIEFNISGGLIGVVEMPQAIEAPAPILASSDVPSQGMMRGEATLETESELEVIDDDIADLFEEDEEFDIEDLGNEDDDWEDIVIEDDEEDLDDSELENWDLVEDPN